MVDSNQQWLSDVRRCPSQNFNQRPQGVVPELLVIHCISLPVGSYGGGYIEQLFSNCLDCHAHSSFSDLQGVEVSSHILIDRDGELTQFVGLDQRAWHAGLSNYRGRSNCNDFSVGIELEGCDSDVYTEQQYQALAALSRELYRRYPRLNADNTVGHSDIAPGRKTDPGPHFDWSYFRQLVE